MLRKLSHLFIGLLFLMGTAQAQLIDEATLKSELDAYTYHKLNKKSVSGDEYDIVYHRLEFEVNPDTGEMKGAITSYFVPQKQDFKVVKFDFVNKFTIDSIVYHGTVLTDFSYSAVQLAITLPAELSKGQVDSIKICYHGDPTRHTLRSYVQDDQRLKSDHGVIYTLSEPYGARDWWPCKQSLTDKIDSVDILVTVPNGNRVASNGLLVAQEQVTAEKMRFHWKHRYPIVTYLIAIGVSNYSEVNDTINFKDGRKLDVINYVYPESVPSETPRIKRTGEMMLLFDSLYGEYPFMNEKYGHAQFGFSGGMEHQTMSFMSDWNFGLVAHELGHQWFGNQVTCGSWQDLWINESFATHMTLVAYEFLQTDSAWKSQIKNTADNVMSENDGSVYVYGFDTADVNRLFSGRLTYRKGALVLRMLRWKIGDTAFFEGCRLFLTHPDYTYGFGKTEELRAIFEQASGQDLKKFFSDWIYSQGFPIYDASWGTENNLVTVSIDQTTAHPTVAFFDLPIPLYFTNDTQDTTVVIHQTTNRSNHQFKLSFTPTRMEFDPEMKLLSKNSVFHSDGGFNNITIYPNPGNQTLNILFAPHKIEQVRMYDMMGRLVLEKEINIKGLAEYSFDVSQLLSGTYVVEATGNGTVLRGLYIKSQRN